MRTKEEIMERVSGLNVGAVKLVLEVLLDIRDSLQITEPEEALIRCVTCETYFKSKVGHFCSPLGQWVFGSTPMGSPDQLSNQCSVCGMGIQVGLVHFCGGSPT